MSNTLQNSVEEKSQNSKNSSELKEIIIIEHTPFHAIRMDQKWFLAMGNYRVSDFKSSKDEVLEELDHINWMLIATMCDIFVKESLNNK